jgi:hypothetical protein
VRTGVRNEEEALEGQIHEAQARLDAVRIKIRELPPVFQGKF